MENYKYNLQLIDNEDILTYEFPGDMDIEKMRTHLRDFLCGAGWFEKQVNLILGEDND